MKELNLDIKTIIALAIMITLMVFTRSHSPFIGIHLPDFTIPALFIAGVYFRQYLVPVILILTAVVIDNFAIFYQGISANCITPAYTLLPIAYLGVYWSAKYIPSLVIKNKTQLIKVILAVVIITSLEWLFSSASYYAFAGITWVNFPDYVFHWAPMELKRVFSWMAIVIIFFTINHHLSLVSYFQTSKY